MKPVTAVAVLLAGIVTMGGCDTSVAPPPQAGASDEVLDLLERRVPNSAVLVTPAPLLSVVQGVNELEFWPYTAVDFSGTSQDPVNVILYGKADPRDVRAALLALDGNRDPNVFPPIPPFNSVWTDGIGDEQTAYATKPGWVGSTIQLECGDHSTLRFHVRLFGVGEWTVANAHFEFLIPGTTTHQVLSWELGEAFLVADLMRTGLLDAVAPVTQSASINESPFGVIPSYVYNLLPEELKAVIGTPPGTVGEDVGIPSDGHASIVNLAGSVPRKPGIFTQTIVLPFDQIIPKPFCDAGNEYLYVQGPVNLSMTTRMSRGGTYTMTFVAEGELTVVQINPMTGMPMGPVLPAFVTQRHSSTCANHMRSMTSMMYQRIGTLTDAGFAYYFSRLGWNNPGSESYDVVVCCGGDCVINP